jgi:hypothetical protein
MRAGDLVQIRDEGKPAQGLIVRYSTDPDRLCWIITGQGRGLKVHRLFAASLEPLGAYVAGKQFLDHEQAKLRIALEEEAASSIGKQRIRETRERAVPAIDVKQGRGRLVSYQEPEQMADDTGFTTEQMDRYLAVRDPKATEGPEGIELDADSNEARYLDFLREKHPRYYRVYVGLKVQRLRANQLAAQEGITPGAARMLMARARRAYDKAVKEATRAN